MSTGKASELDETLQSGERAEATTAPASGPPGRVRSGEPNDYPELVAVDPKHYVIGHEIARGGMGRILRARDRRLGRTVAIKELLSDSPDGRLRLEREARITARLQHPGIVNVLEAGAWPNSDPFYVMKLVDGESLDRVIARASSLEERLGLLPNVIAVVDALAYAHAQNVIHRDLKPSNILVGAFGETVVIDWGLAKDLVDASGSADVNVGPDRMVHGETLAGSVLGTPAYMPPEQAEGEPVDQRADVYSLGAILYHTLSGQPPHTGKTIDELLVNVVSGPPPSIGTRAPGLPPDLVAIVDKAMSFAAGDRYPAAKELAADLKKFQTGQLVGAHRYTGWQLVRRWLRRNRAAVAVALVAATFLVALAITSVLGIMHERERTELQRAAAEKSRGQAEDLMSFMLGDLEEKLEPVGKLPLLEVVARKALAYYAERPATRDPQELQGRATALMNIGRVFLKQGAYEDAHVQFEAALAIRRELLERDPTSVPLANATADAHEFLGELYRRQAKLVDAMREYKAMVEILEQLVIREPTRDDHRYLLAVGLERIGWIEKGRGNIDASLESLRRSRDLRLALDPANPEFQLAVSNSNESIGNVLEIRGDLAGAVAEYRASAAIRSELTSRDPTNMKQHFALALSHDHIGSALAAMGDSAGAMDAFRSELRIAENLTERDATNAEWRDLYGLAKKRIGDVLRDRGDRRGALANYTESEAIDEDIVKHDPSNLDAQYHLAVTYDDIGYLLKEAKDFDRALTKFQASRAIREARSALDPTNVQWRRDVSLSLDGIAEVYLAKGDRDNALATYRDNLRLAEQTVSVDSKNADWQRDLALAHQRVADVLMENHDPAAALLEFRASGSVFEMLVGREPKNALLRRDLGNNHLRVATALYDSKDFSEALAEYKSARTILEALNAEDPTNSQWMDDLAITHEGIADSALALGDRDGAADAYRAALTMTEKLLAAAPKRGDLRGYLAVLRRKLAGLGSSK